MGQQQSTAAPASSSAAEGSGESVSQQYQQALLCLLQAHLVHDAHDAQLQNHACDGAVPITADVHAEWYWNKTLQVSAECSRRAVGVVLSQRRHKLL